MPQVHLGRRTGSASAVLTLLAGSGDTGTPVSETEQAYAFRVAPVELERDEVGLAQQRRSTCRASFALVLLGATAVVVAVWFTVGPWTVSIGGQSYGCGSAFMGRYRSVSDPAASAAAACHLQAANRMHIAEVAWIIGVVLVVLGIVLLMRGRRRSEGSATP